MTTQSPAPLTPEQIAMLERDVDETILKGSPEARGMALALQLFIKPLLSTISTLQAELENLRAKPTADHGEVARKCQRLIFDLNTEADASEQLDESNSSVQVMRDAAAMIALLASQPRAPGGGSGEVLHTLELARDRLKLLLGVEYPESDHPSATEWVIAKVQASIDAMSTPPQAAPGDVGSPVRTLATRIVSRVIDDVLWPHEDDQTVNDATRVEMELQVCYLLDSALLRERTAARSEERERCAGIADTKEAELRAILSVTQNHRTELQATCAAENVKDVAKYIRAAMGTE